MRPNGNDQGFLASYFEFVDCNFIKEPRPHGPKSHKGVFLRTLLNNFPTITKVLAGFGLRLSHRPLNGWIEKQFRFADSLRRAAKISQ